MNTQLPVLHRTIKWLSLCLFIIASVKATAQQTGLVTLKAGAAAVDITPAEAVPMSGYAGREGATGEVHDQIFARAIVFDDGTQKACLIQADLIGFGHDFADEITGRITDKTGIPANNIMLIAAHNHGGPSTRVYGEGKDNKALDKYIKELKNKLVDVAITANKTPEVVETGFGLGRCTMNINRRARQANGDIWLGRNPDGPCDRDVAIMRIDKANGDPAALFVNWPCHATTGGQENLKITGDWPGATARHVQKHYGENVPVAVTAGASADINPIYGPNNRFGDIDAIGLILGEEIVSVTEAIKTTPATGIKAVRRNIIVPGKKRSASRKAGETIEPGEDEEIRLSVIKIGNIVFAGISGELMTEIGMEVKNNSPFRNTIIVTHCNGSSGYLCTDKAYKEGGYEPMVSRVMPGTEQMIVDAFREMLNGL